MTAAVATVATVVAALLRDRDAAKYLGRSPAWIRKFRAEDTKAIREGREPAGPSWVQIGNSIFYKKECLDRWVAENAVERGTVVYPKEGR